MIAAHTSCLTIYVAFKKSHTLHGHNFYYCTKLKPVRNSCNAYNVIYTYVLITRVKLIITLYISIPHNADYMHLMETYSSPGMI